MSPPPCAGAIERAGAWAPIRKWYSNRLPTHASVPPGSGDTSARYHASHGSSTARNASRSASSAGTSQPGRSGAALSSAAATSSPSASATVAEQPLQPLPLGVQLGVCAVGVVGRVGVERAAASRTRPRWTGQAGVVEGRQQRGPGLGAGAQARPAPGGIDRLALDPRLEQVLAVPVQRLRCAVRTGRPSVDRRRGRHHADRERRAGVLALELAQLPLPADQPQRVVDPRLDARARVAGVR